MYNNDYSTWLNWILERENWLDVLTRTPWRWLTQEMSPTSIRRTSVALTVRQRPDFELDGLLTLLSTSGVGNARILSGKFKRMSRNTADLSFERPSYFRTTSCLRNDFLHLIFRIRPNCWPWEKSCRFPVAKSSILAEQFYKEQDNFV